MHATFVINLKTLPISKLRINIDKILLPKLTTAQSFFFHVLCLPVSLVPLPDYYQTKY